ncbi:MAG: T9SS type A sorting domain-containing protein [Bacteroidia bacterium]
MYDTTASGDIDVLISKGAKFIWKPCGIGPSTIWVKNGGALNFKQTGCLTSRSIYIEPGAIIIDPYNTMAANTLTYSCASIAFPVVNCSLGLNEKELPGPEIKTAPNPGSGLVSVELLSNDFKTEDARLIIKNARGAELKTEALTSRKQQVDLSGLNNGIYFLELVSEGKTVSVRKIIKQ